MHGRTGPARLARQTALPTVATHRSPPRHIPAAVGVVALALALIAGCSTNSTANDHAGAHGASTSMPPHNGDAHQPAAGKGLLATGDGFMLEPSSRALTVGEQTVRFQILDPHGKPQTQYVADQTKQMHFYLIRADLTGYQHLHPTLSNGTWSVTVQVPAPGRYRMYSDFIAQDRSGTEHPLVLSTVLSAPGVYTPQTLPAASTTATAGGLTAALTGTITSGSASKVSFRITQGGNPVADLEPYLDSFAHLTALRAGDLAYKHVHPELTASAGQNGGPTLPFSVDLPEGGTWRLFLQVQRAGTLHLLPLTVTVS